MKSFLLLPAIALIAVGLNLSESRADIIASYSFPPGTNAADSEHTTNFIATSVTAAGGGGISTTTGAGFFAPARTLGTSNTLAAAIGSGEFFSFTIETPAGWNADNIEISYDWVITDADNNATVNYSTFLLTDATAFADGNQIGEAFVDDQNNPASGALVANTNNDIGTLFGETQNVSGSLGSGFTLSSGDDLEVRIYLNDNSTASNRFHRVDNIVVTADLTAAVPEPAAGLMLAGLFGMTLLARRRK